MSKTAVFRFFLLFLFIFKAFQGWSSAGDEDHQKAFELNRQGMIAMSMARFGEAIESFEAAAALALDYEIRGEKLRYTPVFHAGWASEKIGDQTGACEAFEKFLKIAPRDLAEGTKIDHAESFIGKNCLESVH